MPFPPLPAPLARALTERGYAEPTDVQRAVLDEGGAGGDLLVSSQTGSGKTIAFGLVMADALLDDPAPAGAPKSPTPAGAPKSPTPAGAPKSSTPAGAPKSSTPAGAPGALVIAPTRELAQQVQAELSWLFHHAGLRVLACVGGMDARREARSLAQGCHVVVGTPGRLRDHLERRQLDLSALRVVVLDEADEMLDLGFKEELEAILDGTPPTRRTLLFSATIPRDIASLARRYQRDALRIDTARRGEPHEDIDYQAMRVVGHETEAALVNILRHADAGVALVFCATRDGVRDLHARLAARGFACVALSGELSQAERNAAIGALRDGRARVGIATDVAARGLDLPELSLVIHADLPINHSVLLHRSGRTGRAGRKGVCVLLVTPSRRRRAELLFAQARIAVRWASPPGPDDIAKRDQERLLETVSDIGTLAEGEAGLVASLRAGQSDDAIAAALIRMYRRGLPQAQALTSLTDEAPVARHAASKSTRERGPTPSMTWFSMRLGRRDKADPKWLIPMLCRLGQLTKRDIGTIQVFDEETRFQIAVDAAERFAANAGHEHGIRQVNTAGARAR